MFRRIELDQLFPSPMNPRKFVNDDEFKELVESIKQKGVINPILVRENKKNGKQFEVIAGERRFRAAKEVYKHYATNDTKTIPSVVRNVDDREAFEIMTIENLQRKDITPLEEAKGFQKYVQIHGRDGEAVEELATRVGKSQSYIRRRVEIMALPKKITKAWSNGKIKFGHMEQLLRLKDNDELLTSMFNDLVDENRWDEVSVNDLKNWIDRETTKLDNALFDKTECEKCFHNSDVQKNMFGSGLTCVPDAILCLKPSCFQEKQVDYFETNWKKTKAYKKNKTNAFLVHEDTDYRDFAQLMYNPEKKECKECNEHFKSVIRISDGYVMHGQVCHGGSPACIKRNNQDESRKGQTYDPITGEHKKTRGAWHGEHYRDEFYRTRIPVRLQEIDSDEDKINRLILYSILDSNDDIHAWFSKEIGHDHGKKGKDYYGTPVLYSGTIWEAITEMDTERVKRLIKEAMQSASTSRKSLSLRRSISRKSSKPI
jgi:ParB family chromosome partitioning protein